ncbi:MAG: hypothetical protein KGH65_01545 [Candidatus Micrarchaeota archaeon]|nr:hypothetical protein [Candidatus Micrarchaeota archaeon]
MDEETIIYLGFTGIVALIAIFFSANYGPLSIVAIVLSIVTLIIIAIINYADFILFPIVTIVLGIKTVPAKNYMIPKNQNCIIKNVNGLYYATGYLTANVYNYVFAAERVDVSEEQKLASGPEKWERIVMNVKFPFKFHLITYANEIQAYREDLEGKRGFLEFQLSKEMQAASPNQLTIDDFQRRINVIQSRIERLSSGERPVGSVMYIESIAVGVSEKAAADALTNQINQLQTVFNSMDLSITRVVGRELNILFRFGYFIPTSTSELEGLFNVQK